MTDFISAFIVLALAALFGGMIAFTVLFAPLVFAKLQPATAGRFIRDVFPWYYLYILVLSVVGALGVAATQGFRTQMWLLALVAISTAYARWHLMPTINRLRDRELAGDSAASKDFQWHHRRYLELEQYAAQHLVTDCRSTGRPPPALRAHSIRNLACDAGHYPCCT